MRAMPSKEHYCINISTCDDDDGDDDDDWEDNMDPITFCKYYAAANPDMAKIVQDHDRKMRERHVGLRLPRDYQ